MEEIFFCVCVWNAVIPYYTFIFVFSGLKYPVKPYEIITNLTIFPVSLCDDGYCAIFISTYSWSPENVTVLEHDQLQDKQQREDIIICTHRRWKFETVFQFTDVKWAQVN